MSAIDYIRERHCMSAIESDAQEHYLERLAAERDQLRAAKKAAKAKKEDPIADNLLPVTTSPNKP